MTSTQQDSSSPSGRRDFLKVAGILAAGGAVGAARPAQADTVDGRNRHKYQELFPEEFYEEQQRAPIIYLPIGAPEEHGLQSVLAVDPWTAYEICLCCHTEPRDRISDHSDRAGRSSLLGSRGVAQESGRRGTAQLLRQS